MKRGAKTEKKRGGGQQNISQYRRQKIRARLRRCLREFAPKPTHQAFADAINVSRNTVSTWLADGLQPPVAETAQILAIADELNIQPTWLLIGEGPELRGAPARVEDVAQALHAHVKGVLASECKANPEFVAAVVPKPAELLCESVDRYRDMVRREVKAQRDFRRRTSVLERALEKAGLRDPESAAFQSALLDWGANQDAVRGAPGRRWTYRSIGTSCLS